MARSVMLHSTAFVEGDIFHQGIGIEMGTHYDGRLKWVNSAEEGLKITDEKSKPIGNDNAPLACRQRNSSGAFWFDADNRLKKAARGSRLF